MALSGMLIKVAFSLTMLSTTVLATRFIVGDEMGWTTGYDYEAWAKNKTFVVGDSIVFRYHVGAHNVLEVNETEYKNCEVLPERKLDAFRTGKEEFLLDIAGPRRYICTFGKRCAVGGQKLSITVLPGHLSVATSGSPAPAPAPAPTPGSRPAHRTP